VLLQEAEAEAEKVIFEVDPSHQLLL